MEPTGLPPAAPLATRVEEAETLKALGNDQFGKKQYALAVTHYTDAVARLPPRAPDEGAAGDVGEAEDAAVAGEGAAVTLEEHLLFSTVAELRVKLYANLAASYLKLVRYATNSRSTMKKRSTPARKCLRKSPTISKRCIGER